VVRSVAVAAVMLLGSCMHRGTARLTPEVQHLGGGVTMAIAPAGRPPAATGRVIPVWITLTNGGGAPIHVEYRDFALSDESAAHSLALLPSELDPQRRATRLLPEGVLPRGASTSGLLYFRLPSPRPAALRVDLEAANETVISRNFVPLRFD